MFRNTVFRNTACAAAAARRFGVGVIAMTKRTWLAGAAALILAGCAAMPPSPPAAPAAAPATLTIVHLNDIYEIQPIQGGKYGGPARVATVLQRLKASGAVVLSTLGGDYLSPSALGTARVDGRPLAGRQMVDVLGAMGLDWATFGNHEFDVSEAAFRAHLREARFRIVSTNVTDAVGQPFDGVPTSAIIPVRLGERSVNIGLIGVTVDSTDKPWVRYREPIAAARAEIARLKGKVDAIIALTHLRLDQDADFAAALPELDLVLGGHEHENWQLRRGDTLAPIIKADANARTLAIVSMSFGAPGERPQVSSRLQSIDGSIPDQPQVAELARQWTARGFEAFRREGFEPEAVIALTTEPLDGREATVRNRSGRLTDLIAAAMLREVPDADAAVFNSGSVRIDDVVPAGPITEYDIIRILPFGGKVLRAQMDGALLARVLDMGENNQGLGGFLHTAGVRRQAGQWQIGEQALDPARRYTVAIADFLLTGGETNLGFLTRANPQVRDVSERRDIRRLLIEQLISTYPPRRN
jgi:5'-nucleotidase